MKIMSSSSEEFDWEDGEDDPPQHKAVTDNDLDTLKQLLKSGKSPNTTDAYGDTPLHLSIEMDRKDIFDYLLSLEDICLDVVNGNEITPLMEAVTSDKNDISNSEYFAIKLIKCGCDLDYQRDDEIGDTALHYTVLDNQGRNNPKVLVELLEHGADVNRQNFYGETPLHKAVLGESDDDCIHILLYYGAIATIHDDDGFLPFNNIADHPDYLQDILFDMTFDNDKIKLSLSTFLSPKLKSNMFYKILEKTSELTYPCAYGHEFVPRRLFQMKANKVKMLFLKFPQLWEDLTDLCTPLYDCVHYLDSDVGNTIELIYFLCENLNKRSVDLSAESLIFKLIRCKESTLSELVRTFLSYGFDLTTWELQLYESAESSIFKLIRFKLPESTLSELVCTFLSYGFDLTTQDLEMVYVTYGYGELFKILLHMPIEKYNMRNFMPTIIYDVELISSFSGIPKVMDDDDRRRTSKFFTIHSGVVPSLLQLSRDVARKHLINSYKIRDNVQFFTRLRQLPISKIYKAILGLERKIYPTQNQPIEY